MDGVRLTSHDEKTEELDGLWIVRERKSTKAFVSFPEKALLAFQMSFLSKARNLFSSTFTFSLTFREIMIESIIAEMGSKSLLLTLKHLSRESLQNDPYNFPVISSLLVSNRKFLSQCLPLIRAPSL